MNMMDSLEHYRDEGFQCFTIDKDGLEINTHFKPPCLKNNKWDSGDVIGIIKPTPAELKKIIKELKAADLDIEKPQLIDTAINLLQKYRRPSDMVKRPDHYTWKKKECREIQRDMVDGLSGMAANNMGNIIKYLYRVGHKDDIKQDLDKAKQFIDFLYEDLQKGNQ